jgi:hypothetical protein
MKSEDQMQVKTIHPKNVLFVVRMKVGENMGIGEHSGSGQQLLRTIREFSFWPVG